MTKYIILKENKTRNDDHDDNEIGDFRTVAEAEAAMAELIVEDVGSQYVYVVATRCDFN